MNHCFIFKPSRNQKPAFRLRGDTPFQRQPKTQVSLLHNDQQGFSPIHQSEWNAQSLATHHSEGMNKEEGFELVRWRAPEATQNVREPEKEFDDSKAAVFSLGLVLFEIESETVPLSEMDAVNTNRQLGTGSLPKMELIENVGLEELIRSCLSLDPSQRPNLDSIESRLDSVEFSNSANHQNFLS
ncbi:hypothetical protein BLNAU_17773 [Blattamonas nauphoetae]|uniref:Protein kinase domain-containing protein n=1 Tax=Blattamonas nauphoetae TaxID=2049346 RepID=A0ABQ9X6A9_9EUKA|nr:hypothetical protein BLNAU_17773 [Blattamonas nauphoetae]